MVTREIENYLQKIQSVIGCKVVLDDMNEIGEIHIISDIRRNPKQILRDVEAILLAEFNMTVDYKKVSIAQIKGESVKIDQDPRLKLKTIEYNNYGRSIDITVTLEKFGEYYRSTLSGVKTAGNMKRLMGSSILRGVEQYLGLDEIFVFEDAKIVPMAHVDIAVVSITSIYNHREEFFTGTATVNQDQQEAVARATLDAVNRHILQLESILS